MPPQAQKSFGNDYITEAFDAESFSAV